MKEENHIRSLWIKYLQNDCKDEELELLLDYLKRSGSSAEMPSVEEVEELFSSDLNLTDESSNRIFSKIVKQQEQTPVIPIKKRQLGYGFKIKIAAALLLLCTASIVLYNRLSGEPIVYSSAEGHMRTLTLRDGSKITLNANSSLKVSEDFGEDDKREVWLDGEAFFSVSHNATKKFIVHATKEMSVEVLGTEFNVSDRDNKAAVVLNKGSVKVNIQPKGAEKVAQLIKPGQRAVYQKNDRRLAVSNVDTMLYSAWKYNLLAFKNTPLVEVAKKIEEQYGYTIEFGDDSTENLRFTGYLPSDTLPMALETLNRSFGMDFMMDKNTIYIKNKN